MDTDHSCLVLPALADVPPGSSPCDGLCFCDVARGIVSCVDRNLTSIPRNYSMKVITLILGFNQLTSFGIDTLEPFPFLTVL